jgi:SAM-dependent methyltransferase
MLGHWPVIAWLRRATKDATKETTLTLVDVGCGYGDLLRAIRGWARKRGLKIRLIGLDLSRETIRIADLATDDADEIEYRATDIFDYTPSVPIDFVVSSLLTHHMSDDLIAKFLRWMEATARKGWLIYDLQRHPVPLHFIGLMGRLTRLHPIVIQDGRISVARSLTRAEWLARIDEANIARDAVQLRWFLFRFVIGRVR